MLPPVKIPDVYTAVARYDLWIGAYWDTGRRRLYLCLLPMLPIVLDFDGYYEVMLPPDTLTTGETMPIGICTGSRPSATGYPLRRISIRTYLKRKKAGGW